MRRKSGRRHRKRNHRVDMSNGQWEIIEPMLPPRRVVGRPREVDLRRVINGIFYVTKTGVQWRHLPGCYGSWQTCYRYYRRFIEAGVWSRIHEELRHRLHDETRLRRVLDASQHFANILRQIFRRAIRQAAQQRWAGIHRGAVQEGGQGHALDAEVGALQRLADGASSQPGIGLAVIGAIHRGQGPGSDAGPRGSGFPRRRAGR